MKKHIKPASVSQVKNCHGTPAKGSWRLTLTIGTDPITKKPIRKYRTFHGTKTEAKRAAIDFAREVESGLNVDLERLTFGEYAAQWIAEREASGTFAATTIKRNKELVEHLNTYLRGVRISDIDAPTIRNLYIYMTQDGVGHPTQNKASVVLKQIMRQAVINGIILTNPCDLVKPPKQEKSTVSISLDKSEVAALCKALDKLETKRYPHAREACQKETANKAHATAVRLILATGLRQGEALGLTWNDVDFDNAMLYVRHTLDRATGKLKKPKTDSGVRIVALDEATLLMLGSWKAAQRSYLNSLGIEQGNDTPVITSEAGTHMEGNNLYHWWSRFLKANNLKKCRLHDLRHTHATLLISSGTNIKAVSARLGHANIGITLDLYAHAQMGDDRKAASVIGSIMY